MRFSQLFTRTTREVPKDEESINAKLLMQAGFVHKEMAGVYSILPLGLKVFSNIQGIIRQEMDALGGQEILMPAFQPKANWEKTGRWKSFDVLFKTKSITGQEYGLGPTHEEIITPLMQKYVSSYRDLPQKVYQIQTKFRDEKRSKSGLLRGREFLMKDLYSFHATQEDLDQYYEQMKAGYEKIFERIGLGKSTVLTFASGGTFSKYSHEFQALTDAGEDTLYLCKNCAIGVNKEIFAEQNTCPNCKNSDLQEAKGVEVGNIFKLQEKFSSSFGLTYKDAKGKEQSVLMGCYGIGIGRIMGTLVEIFHDKRGIIWPESVAPAQIHLISLQGVQEQAERVYGSLTQQGIEVLYDDRQEVQAGEKFADADMIGIPVRLVASKKAGQGKVGAKRRNEDRESIIDETKITEYIKK